MAQIFINYRREDSEGYAGRLLNELKQCVGNSSVFLDAEGIGPGLSFRDVIQAELVNCEVMLVVMGKRWLEIREADGERRLDRPDDVVRLEIGTAIKRGIPVVPILVQGAILPTQSELPDDLKPLAERQAYVLRHDSWGMDVKRLIERLSTIVPSISYTEFLQTKHAVFTKTSFLVLLGSTITIGVAYRTFYLWLDWHDSVLVFTWLLLGLLMGKWHATHVGVNVVRDVLLGSAIAVGGAMIMSLEGTLVYKQPFWPQNPAEWQYTALHMTVIMVSIVVGGALPLFLEKTRTWTKRKVGLIGKA